MNVVIPSNKQIRLSRNWENWFGLAGLILVTLLAWNIHAYDNYRRWLVIPIMLVLILVENWSIPNSTPQKEHVRMGLLVGLALLVVATGSNGWVLILLFFMFSTVVSERFNSPANYVWIAVFGLITTVVLVLFNDFSNPLANLINAFSPTLGYFFMGYTAQNRKRAEAAEQTSRRLLDELREAHAQLQAYADRVEALTLAEERNRLSREMHDTLGHRLTVAAVQLEGAQKLAARDPDRAARMIGTVHGQVVEGLGELRRTVAALREPEPEGAARQPALADALRELARNFAQATYLNLHLDLADTLPPLPAAHRRALYRAAQESLTNIQRHAQASQAWLSLSHQNGDAPPTVTLTVCDDGVGLPKQQHSGFGLRGLHERAAQLGGTFHVESQPDAGVKSTFTVPISTSLFEQRTLNAERAEKTRSAAQKI